jgi:maltose/moltooligosaccharide transporter
MNDFQFMPTIMKQLAWVQFFSWFALFSIGFTSQPLHNTFMAQQTSEAYNTGANQVGEMFANYNLIAAIASFIATIGKIYESNSHFVALFAEDLVLCLFHN